LFNEHRLSLGLGLVQLALALTVRVQDCKRLSDEITFDTQQAGDADNRADSRALPSDLSSILLTNKFHFL
jgi:hypothetical protein